MINVVVEGFLSIVILTQICVNVFGIKGFENNHGLIHRETFLQNVVVLISCALIAYTLNINQDICSENWAFLIDINQNTKYLKIGFIIAMLVSFPLVYNAIKLQQINQSEYYTLVLIAILASLLMFNTGHLILFYLAMELQALCSYVLASIERHSVFSIESGLKYFISGSVFSSLFLLGAFMIYYAFGTFDFNGFSSLLWGLGQTSSQLDFSNQIGNSDFLIGIIGIALVFFTLLFKLAIAPFHSWALDVYDGAPLGSTILFSILPKLPLSYFVIKLAMLLGSIADPLNSVLITCGLISAIFGGFGGIKETQLKRLMIYSSISQLGFVIAGIGASIHNFYLDGYVLAYISILFYVINTIVLWAIYSLLNEGVSMDKVLHVADLRGSKSRYSYIAIILVSCLFSLTGIPPFIGFLGKVTSIYPLIFNNNALLILGALFLLLLGAISAFYYMNVYKTSFFEPFYFSDVEVKKGGLQNENGSELISIFLFSLILISIIFFFFPEPVILLGNYSFLH